MTSMNLGFHLSPMLDLYLKSSALLLAAFGVGWVVRNASAARRHLVWLVAFITLAILPLTLAVTPRWSWSWQRLDPMRPSIPTTMPVTSQGLPDPATKGAPAQPASRLPGWSVIAGGFWLAGALLLLIRQATGFWMLHGMRGRSSTSTTGLAPELAAEFGTVEVRESPRCAVPLTWGCVNPVVLLPVSASFWPEAQLRAALAHEFGHVERRDYLWRQLAQIVRAFFWPNPLVWCAVRALHRSQEQACDDLVLRSGVSPREYAMQLLEAARSLAVPQFIPTQAVAMALPSTLEGRVRAIVDEHRDRRAAGNWSRVAAAVAVIAAIAGSAFAEVKSSPRKPPAAPQVLIELKFIDAPEDAIDPAAFHGGLVFERADVLLKKLIAKKGVDILSAPRLTTRSGQRAVVEIGGGEPGSRSTGFRAELLPSIRGSGPEIDLELVARIATLVGMRLGDSKPVVATRDLKTNVTLSSGRTCICGGHAMKEGRSLLIAVTASIVDDPALSPKKPAGSGGKTIKLGIAPEATEFEGFLKYQQDGTYVPYVTGEEKSSDWKSVGAEKKELLPMEINPFGSIFVNGINWVASDVIAADGTARTTGKALRYDKENREFATEMTFGRKVTGWIETGRMLAPASQNSAQLKATR
jgi:beta-lactamase regulating signal transducer with metallopeptidase domain